MKKLKRKLLTLAVVASSLVATTACSSNIKFNQDDLDKVMEQTQEYLEAQNNYSTEFARNYLIDYLTKGIDSLDDNFVSTKYSIESKQYDVFSNLIESENVTYKSYKSGDTVKLYMKAAENEEAYATFKLIKNSTEYKYEVKLYDIQSKKYTKVEIDPTATQSAGEIGEGEMSSTSSVVVLLGAISNSLSLYNSVYDVITENPDINVIMDKQNDGKVIFTLVINDVEDMEPCLTKLTFENGYLTIWENTSFSKSGFNGVQSQKATIEYNIADFELDNIGSYTEIVG